MEKVLYGFGDSLVDGHCIHVGMLDALAEKYGLAYHKYAVNGATVIPNDEIAGGLDAQDRKRVPDVAAQVQAAPEEVPDYIVFDGLTNDAYLSSIEGRVGKMTLSYGGDYDRATFYGAFERICFLLREKYMDSRIFYVCVHRMPGRDMELQEVLQKAAREVCGKWSIPCVDIFRQGQINTCVEEMRRRYTYDRAERLADGSGTHLTPAGYERWYLPMLEAALNLNSSAERRRI